MSRIHLASRAFGEANENNVKNKLETFFGCELHKSDDPFAVIDFSDVQGTRWAEVKRRRCQHDRYRTIIVGKNKVDYLRAKGGTAIFMWSFDDGDYYIQFNDELFSSFDIAEFQRTDRDGDAVTLVYHVPTSLLQQML
jgi:hypothetical protein